MARMHGRFAQLFVSPTSGGTASPLQHVGTWELGLTSDRRPVTAMGDTGKVYVAGLPDGSMRYNGFLSDTASSSLVAATLDGLARKFYAYPNTANAGQYVFCTMFFDTTIGADVNGEVTMSGTGSAATPLAPVGF